MNSGSPLRRLNQPNGRSRTRVAQRQRQRRSLACVRPGHAADCRRASLERTRNCAHPLCAGVVKGHDSRLPRAGRPGSSRCSASDTMAVPPRWRQPACGRQPGSEQSLGASRAAGCESNPGCRRLSAARRGSVHLIVLPACAVSGRNCGREARSRQALRSHQRARHIPGRPGGGGTGDELRRRVQLLRRRSD